MNKAILMLLVFAIASGAASADTIYVSNADISTVEKFTLGGVGSVFANSSLSSPEGMAFDSSGNLYVANFLGNYIQKFTPAGVSSLFVAAGGLNIPFGLAFDSSDNLYAASFANNKIIKFTPDGVSSVFADLGLGSNPMGLAFDSAGNLYTANSGSNTIVKFTPGGVGSVFAGVANYNNHGLNAPFGLAFDSAGNLYAANRSDNTIEKFTPGGVGSVFVNSGLSVPAGLAFDSVGNLYAINGGNTIVKFTPGGVGSVFASNGVNGAIFITISQAPPVPTSAPSVSVLPAPSNHAISDFVGIVLPQHANEFDSSSYEYLATVANPIAPLIGPNNYFKNVAQAESDALKTVSTYMNYAASFSDVVQNLSPGQKALNATLDASVDYLAQNLLPNGVVTAADKIDALKSLIDASKNYGQNPAANALSFAFSINSFIFGQVLSPAVGLFGHDPADPNFQTIYTPVFTPLSLPTTGNVQLDVALNKQTADLEHAALFLQSVNASFDKYAGAFQAGDNIHATLQMETLLNYLNQYNMAAQNAAADVLATQNLLNSLGFARGVYDPQKIVDLQTLISANGLPSDFTSLLSQLGLTNNEMTSIMQNILSVDPYAFSGTLSDVSNLASNSVLQGTTAFAFSAPEPSQGVLLIIGGAGLLMRRRRA